MVVDVKKNLFALIVAVSGLSVALSDRVEAGNKDQVLTEPSVVSPDRFSRDVSAFYLGIVGGYAAGGSDEFGLNTGPQTFDLGDLDLQGGFGGLRAGWRGVVPAVRGRDYVYGVELAYQFGSLDDDVTTQIGGTTVTGGSEVSDVFSLRFRNGLTNKSGSVLYFVSAGFVRGDVETTSGLTTGGVSQSFSESDSRNGFSVSIGAEHNLTDRWSITGEYEYTQFDSKDITFGNGFRTRSTPKYRSLKFGLNYTF